MQSCMSNKPNHLIREGSKNALLTLNKQLAINLKHMTIVFDYNHFKTIIYTK